MAQSKRVMYVLAGGGGAGLASGNTNLLLSFTRMEALGLAAGMSYAREWIGKVGWYIDNTSRCTGEWRKTGANLETVT
jgi:hypothetical protein